MKRRAGLAILVALACATGTARLSALGLAIDEGTVSIVTESTEAAGWASIEVHTSVPGSIVSINRVEAGYNAFSNGYLPPGGGYITGIDSSGVFYTVYQNETLAPGGYIIGVSAPGYYKREIALVLSEQIKYTFYFTLAMISGTLDLHVSPADASVKVDGNAMAAGVLTLPVGSHTLALSRFGYNERSLPIVVHEKERTRLSVELGHAAFSVSALQLSRKVFNPENAGLFGGVDLRFRVGSFGSATLTIRNSEGEIVGTADFPSFDTWSQVYNWNGRGADGRPLPSGRYDMRLEASAAPPAVAAPPAGTANAAQSSPGAPIVRETEVQIDSALLIRPRGSLSAVPGLLFFSDPRGQPAGLSSTDLTWLGPLAAMQSPSFALSGVVAISDRMDLGYGAAIENMASSAGGGDLAVSYRLGLWEESARLSDAGALFFRGSWSGASSPLLPDASSALEASLPLSIGIGSLEFGAAPGLRLGFSPSLYPSLFMRNGLWLSGSAFRLGLSSEFGVGWAEGASSPSFAWPFDLGLDLRLMLPPSPFQVSLLAMSQLSPAAATSFDVGLVFGLLF
ncbi:MAG: FlgD immunoglobulin-like domain containing protein [Rectinemataceae bacterium]